LEASRASARQRRRQNVRVPRGLVQRKTAVVFVVTTFGVAVRRAPDRGDASEASETLRPNTAAAARTRIFRRTGTRL